MPNAIDISASSMTGLLGAVEASKAAGALSRKPKETGTTGSGAGDDYNLSRFKKGSAINKASKVPKDYLERHQKGSNKGVKGRADKDKADRKAARMVCVAPSVAEQLAMEALERKAKIYEATIRGEKGGLTEQQLESCPLDVDAKRANIDFRVSIPSDEDEGCQPTASGSSLPPASFTGRLASAQTPVRASVLGEQERAEEEWIESKDEFGRDILVPASQLEPAVLDPQRTMAFAQTESASHLQEIGAQYGPQTSFPVLEPSIRPVNKAPEEPIEKYFDPKAERRQLGTGFYALSNDPEERKRQQAELRAREAETEQARAAAGSEAPIQLSAAQLAIESRKRQVQLKREEMARKRAKVESSASIDPTPP